MFSLFEFPIIGTSSSGSKLPSLSSSSSSLNWPSFLELKLKESIEFSLLNIWFLISFVDFALLFIDIELNGDWLLLLKGLNILLLLLLKGLNIWLLLLLKGLVILLFSLLNELKILLLSF